MATEETLHKLREIGKKIREQRERYLAAATSRGTAANIAKYLRCKNKLKSLQEEAGRICETEL